MTTCAAGQPDHIGADLALAFVDDALGATERASVERCIDACAECRGIVAEAARDTQAAATVRERRGSAPPSSPSPPSTELAPGTVIGRYIVERRLAAGGMGVVSLARDPELRRAVVIKLVRPEVADLDLEPRLRREAQAMAQLSHPNVVQIFDIGRHGDRVFLAMEFIAGETLDVWLIERERSVDEIVAMFLQCGSGLEAAHRAGLLHRDFKPTNVLVDRNGVAKVTDFGLARALAVPAAPAVKPRTSGVHAVLTHHDEVIGTPAYMAPEQIAGEPLDARTDQYALALALLDALVGQHPVKRTVRPPIAEGAIANAPPRVRVAVARALRDNPVERFPDLASFLRELAPPKKERRWWPAVAMLALVAGGVSTYLALRPADQCTAETPAAWQRARVATKQKLVARDRAFAGWHAEHVLAKIDAAAAELGAFEIAACEGKPVDVCAKQRRAALDALGPLADPIAELRAMQRCDPKDAETLRTTRELRAELANADRVRARVIAERTEDDLLRADALDRAARESMTLGYFDEAAEDLVAAASTGERAGDDSLRARALLGQLELARLRGTYDVARDLVKQLGGMLERHDDEPRDVYVVATAVAEVYYELGDVAGTFTWIERAEKTAATDDERARVRIARARALANFRFDDEAARKELDAALAIPAHGSVIAAGYSLAVDLALARKHTAVAKAAHAEVMKRKLSPDFVDSIHAARIHALEGHVHDALGELGQIPITDHTARARIDIARASILYHSGDFLEASKVLRAMFDRMIESNYTPYDRVALSAFERSDAQLLRCDAELELKKTTYCTTPKHMEQTHTKSPHRVRVYYQGMKIDTEPRIPGELNRAIEVLVAANARPLLIAELRLQLVRGNKLWFEPKQQAEKAREVFAAAGRQEEVAELNAIIEEITLRPY